MGEELTITTEVGEADRDAGALRYRGVDVRALIAAGVPYVQVWGLLVDGAREPGLAAAQERSATRVVPVRAVPAAELRSELQSALARMAVTHQLRPIHDLPAARVRADLGAATLLVADVVGAATGIDLGAALRADPRTDPLAAYLLVAAEHGTNASTLTARVIASTGADAGACPAGAVGALSGPLHGGAPQRVIAQLDECAATGADPAAHVRALLESGRRVMGFGNRIYRGDDPRAAILRELCTGLNLPRAQAASAYEQAALAELARHHSDRVVATNLEFWAAVLLDDAGVPPEAFTAVFALSRCAGWSAHVLEQRTSGRPIRPHARYTGAPPHPGID